MSWSSPIETPARGRTGKRRDPGAGVRRAVLIAAAIVLAACTPDAAPPPRVEAGPAPQRGVGRAGRP